MSLNDAVSLLAALKDFPRGATPTELAARMGRNRTSISARLGKLAMYDVIDRELTHPEGHHCIAYRYMSKEATRA